MGIHDKCNTGLVLGLGFSSQSKPNNKIPSFLKLEATSFDDEPSLTLGLAGGGGSDGESYRATAAIQTTDVKSVAVTGGDLYRQASPLSTVSSFSNGRVKREREFSEEDEDHEEGVNGRKKLRLSKQQSALLEESFKQHSTLNPKQKQALARHLNLRPRQVEVWFQNRRARTKLKQTEVDCEFLKKCCETLTVENRKLQKEIEELKTLKFAPPFYTHMQGATLTMCSSCEKTGDGNSNNPISVVSKPHHFYNDPLTDPSAAC